ncbi:hypothetical protein V7128_06060 [Neobacillus vireti]
MADLHGSTAITDQAFQEAIRLNTV